MFVAGWNVLIGCWYNPEKKRQKIKNLSSLKYKFFKVCDGEGFSHLKPQGKFSCSPYIFSTFFTDKKKFHFTTSLDKLETLTFFKKFQIGTFSFLKISLKILCLSSSWIHSQIQIKIASFKIYSTTNNDEPGFVNIDGCWLLEPYKARIESLLNCFFSAEGAGWLKKLSSSADRLLLAESLFSSNLDGVGDWFESNRGLAVTGGALKKFENTSSPLLAFEAEATGGVVDVGESAKEFLCF